MANEVSNGLHNAVAYHWEYADAAARTAATGFTSDDLGKWARQDDNDSLWMLTATTPTWVQVGVLVGTAGRVPFVSSGGAGASYAAGFAWDNTNAELHLTGPGTAQGTLATEATGAGGLAVVAEASGVGATAVSATADDAGAFAVAGNSSAGTGVYGYGGGVGVQAETDANGTALKLTAPSGFTGTFFDAQVNGVTQAAIGPSGYLDLIAAAAPSAPASGYIRLYHDVADGHLKFKKSGGAVVDLG